MDLWLWWDTTSGYLFFSPCTHTEGTLYICCIKLGQYKPTGSNKAFMMHHQSSCHLNGKWLQGCEMEWRWDQSLGSHGKDFWRYHKQVWLGTSWWVWLWAHSVGGVTDKTVLEVKRLAKFWWMSTKASQNYSGDYWYMDRWFDKSV